MGIKPTKRVKFKGTWDEKGKTISNADRRRAEELLESYRTISDADRRRAKKILESGRTISDADYLYRNDGGMAKKTRTF